MDDADIARRKADHLAIVRDRDVGFHQTTTLLHNVRLIHQSLPDMHLDEIDTSTVVLGKRLRAPIFIAGMTGGSEQSGEINRHLASIAQERGYGFGLGSQRAMVLRPHLIDTYRVREVAPTTLVLGNIGVVQAAAMSTAEIRRMIESVGADALCVHMNPAQEVVQPEGDKDFRNGLATFERLAQELGKPVVAKETGCGISLGVAQRLARLGVHHVDVSGAGGTSWVAVETERAQGHSRTLGQLLREWGIPTAASIVMCRRAGMQTVIGTGGISTGLDIARAITLGANACGIARPVIQALGAGGVEGAVDFLNGVEGELRAVMLLVGARTIEELSRAPRMIQGELGSWLEWTDRVVG